ncbi:MAG: T9SS type A sorting domain-containing protein [bacterium]|nr:T9SS type A sorting domain-containing protein [bacterium]
MRKLLCLLLVATALLGVGGARADVGPPVHVSILGEPRAAEPGVPFKGQLQITTDQPLLLSDLMFTEQGAWDQISLAAGPQMSVDKARPTVVDFEVVTSDPSQLLELTFNVDGFTVTRSFDLSPATIAFIRGPNPVEKVRDDDAPEPVGDTMVRPEPTPSRDGLAPQDPAKGRNIRVRGRFVYVRSDGWTIGADAMTVRVYDNDSPFGSAELAAVATDAQGYYDVTFWWGDDFFDPQPDIYVRFETTNSKVQTESPAFLSGPYAWDTPTTNDYTGTDLNYGTLQPADINQHPAVHVHTNLVRTWRWWYGYGYDTPFVRGNWPNGTAGAFYNGEIYFSTGEHWNENVATHEYGHHWVELYALSPAPAYCNGICDGDDGCGHCIWCAETTNISFTEGFPDWMGDVIPASWGATYGRAAMAIYDMENLYTCGAGYADPTMTEGFLGAVVRDIGDGTNDNHAAYPETDELSLGWSQVIATVDLDHPTTATAFLSAFKNRYPGYKEGLWATAKNCNYELDAANPPAVTGLYSPSHSTSGDSADPTIDFAWTRANDDCSGVEGYGITIAGGIGLPSAVLDIGDVTSYSTSALPPGTYYFSIRTLDRSGKWSSTYNWSGPYVVRAPVPANLAPYLFAGWSHQSVPRGTSDATFGSVPEPTTLTGASATTWWNVGLWNAGESSTVSGFEIRAYLDNEWHWWAWSGALNSGQGQYGVNLGPLTVRGGRHTFETRQDATDLVAETNESDNGWAHQWVWSPLALTPNVAIQRSAPPLPTAGWASVTDGSALYSNSDGLRMTGASWWDVTVLRPLTASVDHDLYLHSPSTGATNGFATVLAGSYAGSGGIDAVVVNHNTQGYGTSYDVGVVNYDGEMSNYEVVHVTNSNIAYGDSITTPFDANQMLRIWEFYVSAENVGPVSITVDTDPLGGPIYAQWLDRNFSTGSLYTYSGWAGSNAAGRARLDVNIAESGFHALLVYRQPDWSKGTSPINVTIEIDRTPPDFLPPLLAGWYAPLVPRGAFDGTGSSVPAPAMLPGNTASTFLNMAVRNNSVVDSPNGLPGHVYVDGSFYSWVSWGAFPALYNATFNWGYAHWFTGGRHTLAWKLDADNAIEEMYEDNNDYSEQWVWSPLDLVNFTPVLRAMPANQYGGWTELSTGETFYPNCDGLRLPDTSGYWRAVAVMPGVDSDVDLRLHQPSTGAKDGFATNLAGSFWGGDTSDYVLVNFNLTGYQSYDAGVVNFTGYNNYTAESTASGGWISYPNGIYGPYSMAADRILNLHEVYLPAGQTGIHLMNLSGTVDWGVSIHGGGAIYQSKSNYVAISYSSGGAGGNELIVADVPTDGYYCISVWKMTSIDLPKDGTYNLLIKPMWASGVEDNVPTVASTQLVDITPNPFNPQTKITYDLARDGRVQLEIYDLQGHLVRTLVDGARGIGRHVETWNGADDAGGKVASGLYMARLTAGGVTQMMKMTLLK